MPVLRLTPGGLNSQRLEQRPAGLPSHLFVHGGLGPTRADVVVFEDSAPVRLQDPSIELLPFRRDVAGLMQAADVLVLASVTEGSALVTYEAIRFREMRHRIRFDH